MCHYGLTTKEHTTNGHTMNIISKSTGRATAVFEAATEVTRYDNDTRTMVPSTTDAAWRALYGNPKAYLRVSDTTPGRYTVRVSDNEFYALTTSTAN